MAAGPAFPGAIPEQFWNELGADAPQVASGDLAIISERCDYLGWNYYWRNVVQAGDRSVSQAAKTGYASAQARVDPSGMLEILAELYRRYGRLAIYITENGFYAQDEPPVDGVCEDPLRVAFLRDHIATIGEALRSAYDIRGYMVWSLMDNWEWSGGCQPRLGLYYTDYQTQARIPKRSALWYRDFLRSR